VHICSIADRSREALEMGAVGYMLKPVERDKLATALTELADRFGDDRPRRVLLVEDDAVQRDAIEQLIAADGVEVVSARNGAEALPLLRASTFDCMILDFNLPDLSGTEVLEKMASDESCAFPPVIVYTARSLSADEEQELRRYSSSIIIKGARSPERLLDEVSLFLHQVEAKLPAEQRRLLLKARARDEALEGRRLLVVEDDVRNVFALTSLLEGAGVNVEIARNGREALERLEREPPVDLVLMDIMMPEMDGIAATRAIRARPRTAKLPVIALTAKAMRDDQERCFAAGANDFVSKPIDAQKLMSIVRVWMPR
jgi:CheY-like chemotaxis protein